MRQSNGATSKNVPIIQNYNDNAVILCSRFDESQIPVTIGGFELQTSCILSSYPHY